jgi:hypothetical protein
VWLTGSPSVHPGWLVASLLACEIWESDGRPPHNRIAAGEVAPGGNGHRADMERPWRRSQDGYARTRDGRVSFAMGSLDDDETQKGLPRPAYWRLRAEKARRCAREMRLNDARQALLNIAKIYDSMADRAAEREARKRVPATRAGPRGVEPHDHREQA